MSVNPTTVEMLNTIHGTKAVLEHQHLQQDLITATPTHPIPSHLINELDKVSTTINNNHDDLVKWYTEHPNLKFPDINVFIRSFSNKMNEFGKAMKAFELHYNAWYDQWKE